MTQEQIGYAVLTGVGVLLVLLVLIRLKATRRWVPLLVLLGAGAAGAVYFVVVQPAGAPVETTATAGGLFPQPEDRGYVTSTSCRTCHPREHTSWHASYHRTMTQPATTETVVAPFDDIRLETSGVSAALQRRGDEFWVNVIDPEWQLKMKAKGVDTTDVPNPPRVDAQIVMTTGSHQFQVYWFHSGYGRELWQFPWRYQIAEKQWMHRKDAFLIDPDWRAASRFQAWNKNCILCHATGGQPGVDPSSGFSEHTKVAELGIACEACHGPGQKHARRMQMLAAEHPGTPPTGDLLIINPAQLEPARTNDVCGRCHSHFVHHQEGLTTDGPSFLPGKELVRHGEILRTNPEDDPTSRRFWSNGANMSGGREYNGLIDSACALQGQATCLSCHSMHNSNPNKQLATGMTSNDACYQCHGAYRERLAEHTHHVPESSGSQCYNCHMPYTTFALLRAIRSHRIDSPQVTSIRPNGRPNACNLCHLDQTLAWTGEHLSRWYDQPTIEYRPVEREVAASLLWLHSGDPPQRVITAWHLGWPAARHASGDQWMAPHLAHLLEDPYAAVRWNAYQALKQIAGFEDFKFLFDQHVDRQDDQKRCMKRWIAGQGATDLDESAYTRLLLGGPQSLREELIQALIREQDNRPVEIVE